MNVGLIEHGYFYIYIHRCDVILTVWLFEYRLHLPQFDQLINV